MKTKEQLKEYYDNELLSLLKKYERVRLNIIARVRYTAIILTTLAIILSMIIVSRTHRPEFIIIIIPVMALVGTFVYKLLPGTYKDNYKYDIINRVIKFINPDLNYHPNDHIKEPVYKASRLFPKQPDRFKGEDLIKGQYGKTKLAFSELHSEYKTRSDKKDQWHTIFCGLFFMADFNKDFNGYTLVLPDIAQGILGSFGQKLQSLSGRGQLIKLEDPDFERKFVVFGSDQVEARYILSPALMNRILDFKNKTNRNIRLSFIHSCVFVAIENKKNMFEPRLFKTLISFDPIEEYYDDLSMALSIVDDLNLNVRIWTKN